MISGTIDLRREIIKARNHKKPLIVVEGIDDLQFYENIISSLCDVNSVYLMRAERVVGSGGCRKLVSEIEAYQRFINKVPEFRKYFLGIIDRDTFYYTSSKEEIKEREQLKCLYVLKYYSYESYFCNKEIVKKLLRDATRATQLHITQQVVDIVNKGLEERLFEPIYYVGLECLNNKIKGSSGIYQYENNESTLKDYGKRKYFFDKIKQNGKKEELDILAKQHKIKYDIESIKKIVKGKHLLKAFASQVSFEVMNTLYKNCKKEIAVCIDNSDCDKQACIWDNKCETKDSNMVETYIHTAIKNSNIIKESEDIINAIKELDIR